MRRLRVSGGVWRLGDEEEDTQGSVGFTASSEDAAVSL